MHVNPGIAYDDKKQTKLRTGRVEGPAHPFRRQHAQLVELQRVGWLEQQIDAAHHGRFALSTPDGV